MIEVDSANLPRMLTTDILSRPLSLQILLAQSLTNISQTSAYWALLLCDPSASKAERDGTHVQEAPDEHVQNVGCAVRSTISTQDSDWARTAPQQLLIGNSGQLDGTAVHLRLLCKCERSCRDHNVVLAIMKRQQSWPWRAPRQFGWITRSSQDASVLMIVSIELLLAV